MKSPPAIAVRFFRLSEALQPYFTALYLTVVEAPSGAVVTDDLHPEWAAMRFTEGTPPVARIGAGELLPQWPFVAGGPTSLATHFGVERSRIWGLGLQPVGWARFVRSDASTLSNITVDGSVHPAFAVFAPLLAILTAPSADSDDDRAERANAHLLAHFGEPAPREAEIVALQDALRDPLVGEVSVLRDRVGMSPKTLERFCCRFFGFTPKLLLRRQRFARSLAQFMLDPTMHWIDALDGQYHDQAQFVREFRSFMGVSPSEYAARPHPIIGPIMRQRMADAGAAEPLDLPTVGRYRAR